MSLAAVVTMPKRAPKVPGGGYPSEDEARRLEDEAEVVLASAVKLEVNTVRANRDVCLEVGRLLILHLSLRTRAVPVSRADVVSQAAHRLRITAPRVNDLIKVALTVDLLRPTSGDLGRISYSSLRTFANVYDSEAGELKETARERAKEVFFQAILENWTHQKVQQAVWGLVKPRTFQRRVTYIGDVPYVVNGAESSGGKASSRGRGQGAENSVNLYDKDGNLLGRADKSSTPAQKAAHTMSAVATVACPKDLASMILSVISQSLDPAEVGRLVGRGLEAASKPKPKARHDLNYFNDDDD